MSKYSESHYFSYRDVVDKPLDIISPKKMAGNLSASSYDSDCSSWVSKRNQDNISRNMKNFVIQEEEDTESK